MIRNLYRLTILVLLHIRAGQHQKPRTPCDRFWDDN